MQHVFIIGSRGLPAQYGGFETFVDQLVSHQVSSDIQYHVACLSNDQAYYHFDYKGVGIVLPLKRLNSGLRVSSPMI